jgi:hypothetical protein
MGMGTMRSDQNYVHWHQSLEKLKEEWTEFTKELFSALQEEEMNSREESRNCDRSNSQHGALRQPPQKRGGQDE